VRQKLLEDALEFYQGFLEERGSDPATRYETALANVRVGDIRKSLGDRGDAEEPYRRAIQLLEGLVREFPKEAEYLYALANCEGAFGGVFMFRDAEQNVNQSRRCLTLTQRLVAEHPAQPEYRKALVSAQTGFGNTLKVAGKRQEALLHYREGLMEWERLYRDHPKFPKDLNLLAFSHQWLGAVLLDTQQLPEARAELQQAHTLRTQLHEADPQSRRHRLSLAHTKQYMARLSRYEGRANEDEDFLRQAIEICQKLVKDFPGFKEYRNRLASLFGILAKTQWAKGHDEEGSRLNRKTIEQREALLAIPPNDDRAVRELALAHRSLGIRRYEVDELDEEATQAFYHTQELLENYLKDHPGNQKVSEVLADFLAICPASQFQNPSRAIELIKPFLRESTRDADLWGSFGSAHFAAGNWKQAVDAFDKANSLRSAPEPWDQFPLAMCQWQLGQHKEARKSFNQALDTMEKKHWRSPELRLLRDNAAELLGIEPDVPSTETDQGE